MKNLFLLLTGFFVILGNLTPAAAMYSTEKGMYIQPVYGSASTYEKYMSEGSPATPVAAPIVTAPQFYACFGAPVSGPAPGALECQLRENQARDLARHREAERLRLAASARQRQLGLSAKLSAQAESAQEAATLFAAETESARARDAELQASRDESFRKLREQQEERLRKVGEFCFPAETPISVKDSSEQGFHSEEISAIHVGDTVVTCNLNGGLCEEGHVQNVSHRTVDRLVAISFNGTTLRATGNHPFYVANRAGWIDAGNLAAGDQLLTISGHKVVIDQIEVATGEFEVYNLDVEGQHNYYASNVLVHNCSMVLAAASVAAPVVAETVVLGATGPVGLVVTAATAAYALHVATKEAENAKESTAAEDSEDKRFNEDQEPLVEMAKKDKRRGGITADDMEAYKQLNQELGSRGFPQSQVRGPETHPGRGFGSEPHGHVGPVNHIPIVQ